MQKKKKNEVIAVVFSYMYIYQLHTTTMTYHSFM